MSGTLLIIADLSEWQLIEAGQLVSRGDMDSLPSPDKDHVRMFLAPASEIIISKVEFAGLARAQARAAAQLQLSSDSLLDRADFHVAVSDDGEWAATASREDLKAWIKQYQPASIMAPQFMFIGANSPTVAKWGRGTLLATGAELIFTDDALLDHVIGSAEFDLFDADQMDAKLIALTADSRLDLMQGEFAPQAPALIDPAQKRLMIWLALAAALIAMAIPTVQLVRLNASAVLAEQTAQSRAFAAIGGQGSEEQAIATLDAKLFSLRGGGAGFGKTAQAVFAAMQQTAGVEALSLQFLPDGQMIMQVKGGTANDLQQFSSRMAALGLNVSMSPINPAQSQPVVDVRVAGL